MITLLYAALCTLLVLALAGRVVAYRLTHKVGLGDGGHGDLQRRIRAHANAGMELNGVDDAVIHGFGITLFVSRLLHAWGLSRHAGTSIGRFAGTGLTLLLMVAMAVFAIAGFIQQQAA